MAYETLDDGTVLTEEAVDKLVMNAYSALEKGAYKVIPNPHRPDHGSAAAPLRVSEQQRIALLETLSLQDQPKCRLCDVVMNKSTIGFKGGCNPVPLAYTVREGALTVRLGDLEQEKGRFK